MKWKDLHELRVVWQLAAEDGGDRAGDVFRHVFGAHRGAHDQAFVPMSRLTLASNLLYHMQMIRQI